MGESFKALCSFVLLIFLTLGIIGWFDDKPTHLTWAMRIVGPIVALIIFAFLVRLQRRKERAPDFLHDLFGNYFSRDGLGFAIATDVIDGIGYINAFYQNQRDAPLRGQIAVRPSRSFFLTRGSLDAVTFQVDCEPGEFGVVKVPIPIPESRQGKRHGFEVGASVKYPSGKGSRIRFRDGIHLRANSSFGAGFTTALALASAATGSIALSRPALTKIPFPNGVATDLPDHVQPYRQTKWIYATSQELGHLPRIDHERDTAPEQPLPVAVREPAIAGLRAIWPYGLGLGAGYLGYLIALIIEVLQITGIDIIVLFVLFLLAIVCLVSYHAAAGRARWRQTIAAAHWSSNRLLFAGVLVCVAPAVGAFTILTTSDSDYAVYQASAVFLMGVPLISCCALYIMNLLSNREQDADGVED